MNLGVSENNSSEVGSFEAGSVLQVSEHWRQSVLAWLTEQVPESRLNHCLRVEAMAIDLAAQHGLNVEQAAQAGLMHDLAKYFKPETLLAMARAEDLIRHWEDEANPHLLHADVSALVARDRFGVQDPEILAAIANHTLGQPEMSDLSCVVFLADSLEPGRGDSSVLTTLRQMSRQDLQAAVWMTGDVSVQKLLQKRKLIHPRAIATRNWFLHQSSISQSSISQSSISQSSIAECSISESSISHSDSACSAHTPPIEIMTPPHL